MIIAIDRPVLRARPATTKSLAKGPAWAENPILEEYPVAAEGLGAAEGFSAAETPAELDPILVVPRFVKEMIAAQGRCSSDKAPNLTVGEWLHAQPPAVQRRERLRALRKLGLVVL